MMLQKSNLQKKNNTSISINGSTFAFGLTLRWVVSYLNHSLGPNCLFLAVVVN